MFRWIMAQEDVDPSPTAADFPVRVWGEDEIQPEYAVHLRAYLERGLQLSDLLYVPKPKYEENGREYMLANVPEAVLYLERQPDGSVFTQLLDSRHISAVCMTENLLKGCIAVYWQETAGDYKIEMLFNRVRRELFEPFLNKLLDCPVDFDSKKTAVYQMVPERMKEQLALYRYAPEACRFGSRLTDWQWWETGTGWHRKRKKRRQSSACAMCRSEKGQIILNLAGNQMDVWYLPDKRSGASVREDKHGKRLVVTLGYYEGKHITEIRLAKA